MNIIEVMKLEVGTRLKCSVTDKIIKIIERDNAKFLVFEGDFRRLFLDNDVTEAIFEIAK